MNIQTVRDNLRNTIAGKEKMLEKMHPNNPFQTEYMDGAEKAAYYATKEFLKVNINELQRILTDVEACMEWDQCALSTFEKLEEFKNKRNYPIPPKE